MSEMIGWESRVCLLPRSGELLGRITVLFNLFYVTTRRKVSRSFFVLCDINKWLASKAEETLRPIRFTQGRQAQGEVIKDRTLAGDFS